VNPKSYLAVDLGAESGRALLGRLQGGGLILEEIHRFPNGPVEHNSALHWDLPRLWMEVRGALGKLGGTKLDGVGVDAWGVDYALLSEGGELLQSPFHYRDPRTTGVMEKVFRRVSKQEIYACTGIQFMPINTLYQLVAHHRDTPGILEAAHRLLTIPDLFNFWLTGKAVCEYTNATTTQLIDAATRSWAEDLMKRLDLPTALLADIVEPGTILGTHAGTPVIAPASHDTASAVAAIMAREDTAFISSGTWSLVGMELDAPVINAETLRLNFTNEGGAVGATMLLKNVMGLWMLQCCRREWSAEYPALLRAASDQPGFRHLVDPDDQSFLYPENMPAAIGRFCTKTDQPVPESPGAFTRAILESLALKYRIVIQDLEQVTSCSIKEIRMIGGGSRNRLLNQFTADATGRRVLAGPAEATALGNIAVQMIATGHADSLQHARAIIVQSFPAEVFEPRESDAWSRQFPRFQQYCER
jgi:rhamnulokinase